MKPFFSIGVTTYDRVDMLKETLLSILGQTFSDFEVIVSNDNPARTVTGDILGIKDPRIRFINQPKNLNTINNMNYVLRMSNSDYFTWLGDDDLFQPNFLHSIHNALLKFDFPTCIFTTYKINNTFVAQDNLCAMEKLLTGRHFLRHYLSGKIKVQGCYGVFRSQHIKDISGLPQLGTSQFSFYTDSLLAIKCGMLEKVGFINAPLVFYRAHEDSISFSSPDVDAYSSAQRDLLAHSINIFKDAKLRDDFDCNLFDLLHWCIRDYFIVMGRSGRLQWKKLANHLLFLSTYIKHLRNYQKIRITAFALVGLYRLVYYHFLDVIKKRICAKR